MLTKGSFSLLVIAVSFLVGIASANYLTPQADNEETAARRKNILSSGSIRSFSHRELLSADPPQCPQGFVDCVQGIVASGTTTCTAACGGKCCVGDSACDNFTGKVCKDGSCNNFFACRFANVPYVVNSCKADSSCFMATLSSNMVGCCNTANECKSMNDPSKCTPSLPFVDCEDGYVRGTKYIYAGRVQGISCREACAGKCCVGSTACNGFTGKVTMDGSCSGNDACGYAEIKLVVNSCTRDRTCVLAKIYQTLQNCCNIPDSCDSVGVHDSSTLICDRPASVI
jgi:hypothetical protein